MNKIGKQSAKRIKRHLVDHYRNTEIRIRRKGKYEYETRYSLARLAELKQHAYLAKAISRGARGLFFDRTIINKRRWRELHYFHPYRIIPCIEATLDAIEAFKIPVDSMHMFTVIEGDHETDNVDFDLDLPRIKRKYQHGLRGENYIGMIELAYFKHVRQGRGELIAPHFQGIKWGMQSKWDKNRIAKKFSGGRNGAVSFVAKKVNDLVGAVSYMHKLPVNGYMLRRERSYCHTTEYLSHARVFDLFQKLKELNFEDFLVSGGAGVALRDDIIRRLKAKRIK